MNKNNIKKFILFLFLLCNLYLIIYLISAKVSFGNNKDKKFSYIKIGNYIEVYYPLFDSDKINNIIQEDIYKYVRGFKKDREADDFLMINYEICYKDEFANVVYHINNKYYRNIIIDLKREKRSYITNVFDKEFLFNQIKTISFYKYDTSLYNKIINNNINNFTYLIYIDKLIVYFDDDHYFEIKL